MTIQDNRHIGDYLYYAIRHALPLHVEEQIINAIEGYHLYPLQIAFFEFDEYLLFFDDLEQKL